MHYCVFSFHSCCCCYYSRVSNLASLFNPNCFSGDTLVFCLRFHFDPLPSADGETGLFRRRGRCCCLFLLSVEYRWFSNKYILFGKNIFNNASETLSRKNAYNIDNAILAACCSVEFCRSDSVKWQERNQTDTTLVILDSTR